ncbi:MAG: carbonic anhydrase, partial [Anaerolineae bacterium]
MKISLFLKVSLLCATACFSLVAKEPEQKEARFDTSLKTLIEGNERYVNDTPLCEDQFKQKRETMISKQRPLAAIVGCSDSRVPPEIVFDQSLGDLFVVRVAGNVVGPIEMDSIEFSADKLHTPLIVVLGHEGCAAVKAVLEGKIVEEEIVHIAPFIQPAVD